VAEEREDTVFEKDPDGGRERVTRELQLTDAEVPVRSIPRFIRQLNESGMQVQDVIATGGMASVERVVDPALRRRVARKRLRQALRYDKKAVAAFVREAHITGQLDHPNIVPVHDLEVGENDELYFTMKLVEGRTLEQIVRELPPGRLDRSTLFDLLGVVVKICDALALAHSRGVIHADIKPPNVMVGSYGQVYLMDWGIARLIPPRLGEEHDTPVTSWVHDYPAEGISGTPGFMPPEQAAERELDARADIFSVGTVVYFILARQSPFRARNAIESLRLAYRWQFPPLDQVSQVRVPRALSQIVRRAMAREPVNRYATITELRDDLVEFMRGGGSFGTITVDPGQHVVREGEEADAAYIVVSGRLQVYTKRSGRHETLAELGEGDVFGETAILASTTRTASVVAATEAKLRVVERDVFEQELDDIVPWMGNFTRALARRFRESLTTGTSTTALRRIQPTRLVASALMFIVTWGEGEGEAYTASWSALVDHVKRSHSVNERALALGLSRFEAFEVDPEADRVTLTDIAALKERLRKPLGLSPEDSTAEAPLDIEPR